MAPEQTFPFFEKSVSEWNFACSTKRERDTVRPAGGNQLLLARLFAQSRARPALRLSRPRTLGASGRTSRQSGPYARAIEGQVQWDEAVFPHFFNNPDGRLMIKTVLPSCQNQW
jgi:hypothetical protein